VRGLSCISQKRASKKSNAGTVSGSEKSWDA